MGLGVWGGLGSWDNISDVVTSTINFDVAAPEFNVSSSTFGIGETVSTISFDVEGPEFNITGESTNPPTTSAIQFDVTKPEFNISVSILSTDIDIVVANGGTLYLDTIQNKLIFKG